MDPGSMFMCAFVRFTHVFEGCLKGGWDELRITLFPCNPIDDLEGGFI